MFESFQLLAATDAAAADGLISAFGLDWRLILAQGVNFLLVAGLLWKFAFKPVMTTMDERKSAIAQGLADAERAKQQLESAEVEKAAKLQEANVSAQAIVQEARTQAEEYAARQKGIVESELTEKRRRADEAIALERDKVLNEARGEIARLVVLTSGKVLHKELSDEEKSRLNAAAAREMASVSN